MNDEFFNGMMFLGFAFLSGVLVGLAVQVKDLYYKINKNTIDLKKLNCQKEDLSKERDKLRHELASKDNEIMQIDQKINQIKIEEKAKSA